jgi:hypothetical protein
VKQISNHAETSRIPRGDVRAVCFLHSQYDSCSRSQGDSAKLPEFTIDYASVQQVIYANSSNNTSSDADCDIHNDTVLTYGLYANTCRQNCLFNDHWDYCTFDYCVNSTANVTYYASDSYYCDDTDKIGHQQLCGGDHVL